MLNSVIQLLNWFYIPHLLDSSILLRGANKYQETKQNYIEPNRNQKVPKTEPFGSM